MKTLRWLYPGLRVKRWVLLIGCGVVLVAAGTAILLNTKAVEMVVGLMEMVYARTGRVPNPWVWGAVVALAGAAAVAYGLRQMVRSITQAISPKDQGRLMEALWYSRRPAPAQKIVAVGGGTGLSSLLRGLKECPLQLSALVTVSDDGGSSGRLRREIGMPPPGDIRNCLVALAGAEPLMKDLFQYRFDGEGEQGLAGHSFGNLLIAAMTGVTGDFERAVKETSKVLAIRGRVLPSTLQDVTLWALMEDGTVVRGESAISGARKRIRRVYLEPPSPEPLDEAIEAIAQATAIVVGPGSVYTSVIPNLLVKGMVHAITNSSAVKIYVCNVMTQPGETDGYSASRHLAAVAEHMGQNPFHYALINQEIPAPEVLAAYQREGAQVVEPDLDEIRKLGTIPVGARLLSRTNLARHHPEKLASALLRILAEALDTRRARG